MNCPTEPSRCTGCQCCRQLCPAGAIKFEEDSEGFLAPVIDQQLCTDCGLCVRRCPANHTPALHQPRRVIGARYILDDKQLSESASGGVCYALSRRFLEGGNAVVFGAALDQDNVCRHIAVSDRSDLHQLQSSKYVQSDIGDTYQMSEQALKAGKKVLFTGTPCQIAGLYAYLGTDYDNLFTIDLICGGVPSPGLFRLYIKYLEEQERDGKIIYFNFRSKAKQGWNAGDYLTKTKTKTKTKTIPLYKNEHIISFMIKQNCQRECCYTCQYAEAARVGDLTAADFWGVQESHPEFNDRRGCSAALINTGKGAQLAEILTEVCATIESSLDKVTPYQRCLREPIPRPAARDTLLKDIRSKGTEIFRQKEFKLPVLSRWKAKIKYYAPRTVDAYKVLKKAMMGGQRKR